MRKSKVTYQEEIHQRLQVAWAALREAADLGEAMCGVMVPGKRMRRLVSDVRVLCGSVVVAADTLSHINKEERPEAYQRAHTAGDVVHPFEVPWNPSGASTNSMGDY